MKTIEVVINHKQKEGEFNLLNPDTKVFTDVSVSGGVTSVAALKKHLQEKPVNKIDFRFDSVDYLDKKVDYNGRDIMITRYVQQDEDKFNLIKFMPNVKLD